MLHKNEQVTRQWGGAIAGRRQSAWLGVAAMTWASVMGISVARAQAPTDAKGQAPTDEKPAAQSPADAKAQASTVEQGVAKAGAKIVVEEMTFDFGEVWAGTKVQHAYVVRNDGDSLLKIISVKPSCGCTVAQDYDRQILPGEAGKIPITLDTSRLGAKVTKHIAVKSSDPNNETINLTVDGAVKQRINVDPVRGGSFGRIKPSETIKRTLTLTNNTGKPVDLSVMTPEEGAFRAELKEVEPKQVWELTLSTQPPYQEQYNRGNIKLKTGIEEQPVLDIPANVYVLPEVEITPTDVIIPKAQPAPSTQPVRVTFNTDESYKVLSAAASNPQIKTSIDETRPNAFTVTLKLPVNYLPPEAGDKLTILTDHPTQKEFGVNIVSRQAAAAQQERITPAEQLAGQAAPPAQFVTTEGKTINPEKGGDISVYTFYASWCAYCKKALPDLDKMSKEFKDQGVRFVGVNQDALTEYGADVNNQQARTKEQVEQQWKDLGIGFAQAYDPNGAGKSQFRVRSFPTMFLIGKSGKVERVYAGGGAVKDGTLKKEIGELIAGKELEAQEFKATAAAAEESPQPPTPPAQGLAGQAAPKATFVTSSAGSFNAVEPDHVTFAMFYASWCPHCKKALPKLEELNKAYQEKGVRFVAVSQDTLVEDGADTSSNPRARTRDQVVTQFKDSGCSFAQTFDPENAGRNQFKVSSYPTMFLIDQGGKVDKVYIGGKAVEDGTLKRDIEALLSKKGSGQVRAEGSEAAKVAGR